MILHAKQFIIKYNEPEFQGGKTHENNAASGSTVVTVKPETLEKLSEGEHAVKLSFDDGEVIVKLTVEPGQISPDTGDNSNMILYAGMLTLALTGLAVLLFNRKKKA